MAVVPIAVDIHLSRSGDNAADLQQVLIELGIRLKDV
jgi:hypothetical protein